MNAAAGVAPAAAGTGAAPLTPDRQARPAGLVASAHEVCKAFKASDFSLDPISLDLHAGAITGVVGRNASGKTTLLRILIGDLAPDAGAMRYPGLEGAKNGRLAWARIKRQIAFIPQSPGAWRGLLRSNLNFIAATHAPKGEDVAAFVDRLFDRYGMTKYALATWDEISGGYKMRFELVRALAQRPKLLVLDEPLAHLDVVARQRFLGDLKSIAGDAERPVPVVVTSQHLSEIEAIADQMVLLDGGTRRYVGSLAGLAEQASFFMLEIGLAASREELEAALAGVGVSAVEPTLEGFILTLPKDVDTGRVLQSLIGAFGRRLRAWRDITGSTRSLMTGERP